jgi:hypothetical protein
MHLPIPLTGTRATISMLMVGALMCGVAGCGSSSSTATDSPPPPVITYSGVTFSGKALAGKQPLIGSLVQLYTTGTSGNGSSATALLSSPLTTDINGAFTVPAGYTCPLRTSQIYVVARGGQPGSAASSANSAIMLLTVLGENECQYGTCWMEFTNHI